MNPNTRESAYVISRIKDSSNVPASTEYLPLLVCLTPKGPTDAPYLIRDVDTLIETFGDPSINPKLYRDLVTIRDFVSKNHACWIRRVNSKNSEFGYQAYITDGIQSGMRIYFKYKDFDKLPYAKQRIVNCGYYSSTSAFIQFRNEDGEDYFYRFTSIQKLVSDREMIFAQTNWEMLEYPQGDLLSLAQRLNNLQLFTTSAGSNGTKYITFTWLNTYTSERVCHYFSSSDNLYIDDNGILIFNSAHETIPHIQKVYPVIQNRDSEFTLTTIDDPNAKFIIDSKEYVYQELIDNQLYFENHRASGLYVNENMEIVDVNGALYYNLGAHRIYIDNRCIMDRINRVIHTSSGDIDVSFYKAVASYAEIEHNLNAEGIIINVPEGYTSSDIYLNKNDKILNTVDVDVLLYRYTSPIIISTSQAAVLTYSSVKKLVPNGAGWKVSYVMYGSDVTNQTILVQDSITLSEHFTDGEFARKMESPYAHFEVEDPDSDNIYRVFEAGFFTQVNDILTESNYADVTASDYANAIKDYSEAKYYGTFIGDLCFPLLKGLNLYNLSDDDRKAIHYYIKEVAEKRKDLICIFTTPDLPVDKACAWVNSYGDYSDYYTYGQTQGTTYAEQSFYCEMYYGWMRYKTAYSNGMPVRIDDVVPTLFVMGNIIDSWLSRGISFPVAGDNGGVLPNDLIMLHDVNAKSVRDKLVSNRINPICDTGLRGIQIYGNETLNPKYSDLSAAHIGRLMVMINNRVTSYTETVKFSLNNQYTWGGWINYVTTKILEPIKVEGGLTWYNVQMGTETTTPEEIANRRVNGKVSLQFRPDLEIVDLDYVVYPSSEILNV